MTPAARAAAVSAARGPRPAPPRSAAQGGTKTGQGSLLSHSVLKDPRLPGIELSLEMITPELAELYLSKLPPASADIKQRALSPKTVSRYSGDMGSDQWPFTGDPIRFNLYGELIDGQHRLRAVIESGITQPMVVIRGLEPETFAVFDTGRARGFRDVLTSTGVANTSLVAGVTRRVFYWCRGGYGVQNVARWPNPPFLTIPASPGKLFETFNEYKLEIQAAARRGGSFKNSGFATKTAAPGVVGFIYMLLHRIDAEACERFFHELQVGPTVAGPEYPIAVLRKRLFQRVAAAEQASADWVWMHFFLLTWNNWLDQKSMGALRTPPYAAYSHLAKPKDPHAATREEGWEPIPRLSFGAEYLGGQ